jgi:hypothetical protein
MRQRKIRSVFVLMVVISLLLPLLSACKSAALQTIEDAASVLQLTKGREVNRWTQDTGKALGKPVYPDILIVYEPVNNHTRKEVYEEIVTILKKNNWQGKEPFADYFVATLRQGGFEISTEVSIDENKNIVTIKMTIY